MIDFSNWQYRNGGWESPDFDWRRWHVTMDTFWQPEQKPDSPFPDYLPPPPPAVPSWINELKAIKANELSRRAASGNSTPPQASPASPSCPPDSGGDRPASAAMFPQNDALPMHTRGVTQQ